MHSLNLHLAEANPISIIPSAYGQGPLPPLCLRNKLVSRLILSFFPLYSKEHLQVLYSKISTCSGRKPPLSTQNGLLRSSLSWELLQLLFLQALYPQPINLLELILYLKNLSLILHYPPAMTLFFHSQTTFLKYHICPYTNPT